MVIFAEKYIVANKEKYLKSYVTKQGLVVGTDFLLHRTL
jgi:hypothetical protein